MRRSLSRLTDMVRRKPGRRAGHRDNKPDPLACLPLTQAMAAHFDWMLMTGYTESTVRGRRIAIRRFIAWCHERGLSAPSEITLPILERYQRHLFHYRKADGSPLGLGMQFGCLTPLRSWFKWLARQAPAAWRIAANPADELTLPRMPHHLPRALLSVAEVETMLLAADPATPAGLRDRAMLEVLYSTGLRRTELAALQRYDVDLIRLVVSVREGKGRRDRIVPLGARAGAWVDRYLIESRPALLGADSAALFVSNWGEPVTPDQVALVVRRCLSEAGIAKPGACHLLRHACATHMLENGAETRFIQALLGHASLATTARYTHVAITQLQKVHAQTHPARLTRTLAKNGIDQDQLRTTLGPA